MRLVTLPGVFSPISDSRLLARRVVAEGLPPDARVLDVCTGSGYIAVRAALTGIRDVTAIDVSRRARVARRPARAGGGRALRPDRLQPALRPRRQRRAPAARQGARVGRRPRRA